jgi:hypothetical protein
MQTSHRLLYTIITVVAVSFIAGLLWRYIFDARIPGYLAGLIGGLVAVPVWEGLKRVKQG